VFYNDFRDTQQSNEEAYSDLQDLERQVTAARTLFPPTMDSTRRLHGFQLFFPNVYNKLPSSKHIICSYLDVLRLELIAHYSKVEATLPHYLDLTASHDLIYDNFKDAFTLSQKFGFILAFIPDIHTVLRKNLKRRRAESSVDNVITGGIR